MHNELYGFQHMPFAQAVIENPDLIHLNKNYEMPLAILVSSLDKGVALTLMLGENGIGKTTFINYLRNSMQQNFTVSVVNGNLQTAQDLFQNTLTSLGNKFHSLETDEIFHHLSDALITTFDKQNQQSSLLIIDDADQLAIKALKGINLLLELNSENRQLLQVVLFGNQGLLDLLNAPDLQNLSVGTQCLFEPLTVEDTQSYINHQIKKEGVSEQKLFDEQVCLAIHQYSGGIPKIINSICQDALLRCSAQKKNKISLALIDEIAKSSGLDKERNAANVIKIEPSLLTDKINERWLSNTKSPAGAMAIGLILVLIVAMYRYFLPPKELQAEIPELLTKTSIGKNSLDQSSDKMEIQLEETKLTTGLIDNKTKDKKTQQSQESEQESTENQLVLAENHLQSLRLSTPEGNNALEIYRSILVDDPENEKAHKGIKRIAEKYVELAERESRLGKYDKASEFLIQAATLKPQSKEIRKILIQTRKLKNKIKITKFQQSTDTVKTNDLSTKDNKVFNLLALAEKQLAAEKLTLPEKDNALETYTAVLAIDPNEKNALTGLQRIANTYLTLAKKQLNEDKLEKSQQFIDQGLKVSPDHNGLVTLKNQIDRKMKLLSQQAKIEILVKKATQQISTLKLIQPPGDNAFETYNNILKIDLANETAKEGLSKLEKKYQEIVIKNLSARKTNQAIVLANEGLKVFPNNQNLRVLRNSAVAERDAAVKEIKEMPVKKSEPKIKPFANF